MNLDYYDLPFGAQLLLWTSRVVINTSCGSSHNKYELVNNSYHKDYIEPKSQLEFSF